MTLSERTQGPAKGKWKLVFCPGGEYGQGSNTKGANVIGHGRIEENENAVLELQRS